MPKPRMPTLAEMYALSTISGQDEDYVHEMAYIAVFDHFVSEGPGYVGKIMLVVWAAGPSLYEVFTWNQHGEIQRQPQDTGPIS